MSNLSGMSQPLLPELAAPLYSPRPRQTGITSVLDKGLGFQALQDLVDLAGPFVDLVKLGWGTSALYPPPVLAKKIALLRGADVAVCPGGTLLEIAWARARTDAFFGFARDVGFTDIEVSDGTYCIPTSTKLELIERAARLGFRVVSEVGKKASEDDARLTLTARVAMVRQEIDAGAWKVIIEGRESGTVGIYDGRGAIQAHLVDALIARIGLTSLVFEAPQRSQQVWLLRRFGPDVSFGNVPPDEVLSLATLRCGLRSDTAAPALPEVSSASPDATRPRAGALLSV